LTKTVIIIADIKAPTTLARSYASRAVSSAKGDWLSDTANTPKDALQEGWAAIPSATDAYLDIFNVKTVVVPWGPLGRAWREELTWIPQRWGAEWCQEY